MLETQSRGTTLFPQIGPLMPGNGGLSVHAFLHAGIGWMLRGETLQPSRRHAPTDGSLKRKLDETPHRHRIYIRNCMGFL